MSDRIPHHQIFAEFLTSLIDPPARVRVTSVAMPNFGPGYTAFEIIGDTAADVQREVTRLMSDADDRLGSAEFENPQRQAGGKWRSAGYTACPTEQVA